MDYWKRLCVAFDQLANTILGGSEDETISSAVGRKAIAGIWWALVAEKVINAVFYVIRRQKNHCRNSIGI